MAKTLSDRSRDLIRKLGGKTTISRKDANGETNKQVIQGVPTSGTLEALVTLARKSESGVGVGGAINGAKVSSSGKGASGNDAALLAYQILMNAPEAEEVPADFLALTGAATAPASEPKKNGRIPANAMPTTA